MLHLNMGGAYNYINTKVIMNSNEYQGFEVSVHSSGKRQNTFLLRIINKS
jgi:hypothetical protein